MLIAKPWGISAIVWSELAKLVQLGRLDFHGDPADGIIAAISVVHGVPLLTRDRAIRKSKLTPLAIR